jgi:AraC family transcriptional regulator
MPGIPSHKAHPIWMPTASTSVQLKDARFMHGGPQAMSLPEHEHIEVQVQTRFQRGIGPGNRWEPFSTILYAPGEPHRGSIEEGQQTLVMLLGPSILTSAAGELYPRDRYEIRPFRAGEAPVIQRLHQAVLAEFQSGDAPGRLFLSSIAHAMAAHLLSRHAIISPRLSSKGLISSQALRRIDRFIDERIGDDFDIADLAQLAGFGPQRFSQRFRATTGMSPWRYVQARRLERAKALLGAGNASISEIALSLGYCNQSHFTNTFRKAIGVTPRAYRSASGTARVASISAKISGF